jgi:MFS family permease
LALFILAHFAHHLAAAFIQPLTPFIRDEFHLDYTQIGWVISAFNLSYGFSHLPAGWLSDRLGPRLMILIGISGMALFTMLMGLAPTYLVMIVFVILLGIMGGGYHPAASPVISASVGRENQGRALGLHQIGGSASFFLTPLIAVAIARAVGWRGSIISMAIPVFIIGIVLFIILGKLGYAHKAPKVTASPQAEPRVTGNKLRRLVIFITLGVFLQVLVISVASYIPLFAVDSLQTSAETGALLLSFFHFAGLWAGPLGGYLSDRVGTVPVMLAVSLIAGPALYLLSLGSLSWSVWLVLLISGMCMYISMPVTEAYVITHAPQHRRSTVLGIYYFASRGGSGLTIPLLGYLADRYSFATGFTMIGMALLGVAIICTVLLWGSRD